MACVQISTATLSELFEMQIGVMAFLLGQHGNPLKLWRRENSSSSTSCGSGRDHGGVPSLQAPGSDAASRSESLGTPPSHGTHFLALN